MQRYVIQNVNDNDLLWSNTCGWTDDDDFDVFNCDETLTLHLPTEGKWVELLTM